MKLLPLLVVVLSLISSVAYSSPSEMMPTSHYGIKILGDTLQNREDCISHKGTWSWGTSNTPQQCFLSLELGAIWGTKTSSRSTLKTRYLSIFSPDSDFQDRALVTLHKEYGAPSEITNNASGKVYLWLFSNGGISVETAPREAGGFWYHLTYQVIVSR